MNEPVRCASCGQPLDPPGPGGLCPVCLLRMGLDAAEGPDTAGTGAPSAAAAAVPGVIGPYHLLQVLGEGGMGLVYLAEQREPLVRRVALKLIKPGMDTGEVLARFEAERQALALMDHPSIARVLDAGLGPGDRPYFVMEYVAGIPITDYCDRHRLPNAERLPIFLQVCAALQHAHQKGIIHRDLKPSNILVTVQDGKPVPKVIDFGIAKATRQGSVERAAFTQLGMLVGTPEYISPEQAEASGLEVDTTTDIYSLGVVLYELLTGVLPFDSDTLRRAGYAEMHRIIREQDPPKPSLRVTAPGPAAADVARQHQTTQPGLGKQLRGDLDAIAMKAMEKDRTRRYASASEFASDITRYLNGEAVVASPPSVVYRTRKFVRRHRLGIVAAAIVVAALVVGLTLSTLFYLRAAAAQVQAERQAYAATISYADSLASAGRGSEALTQLDLAPTRLRGWEWNHLFAKADTSIATLPVWGEANRFPYRHSRFVFSADGATVYWNTEGSVASWDARSHVPRGTRAVRDGIRALAPSGQLVVTTTMRRPNDGVLRIVNVESSVVVRVLDRAKGAVGSAAFAPDGRSLAAAYADGVVGIWSLDYDAPMSIVASSAADALAFSPDGKLLAVAKKNASISVVDTRSRRTTTSLRLHGSPIEALAFAADNSTVASGHEDGTIRLWKLAGPVLSSSLTTQGGAIQTLAFNPDASRIVSGGQDGMVRVWDIHTGRQAAVVTGDFFANTLGVMAVAYSRDGREVYAAGGLHSVGATVQVWDANRLGPFIDLAHDARPLAVTFAPDGTSLAVGCEDGSVRTWDTRTVAPRSAFAAHPQAVTTLSYDPNGRILATASEDATIRIWETATSRLVSTLAGHTKGILTLAFSPAGTELASGGDDGSVRLWDATSGSEIVRWEGQAPVQSLAFSPSGIGLVFGAGDPRRLPDPGAMVRVWDWRANRLLATATGASHEIPSAISSVAVRKIDGQIAVGHWGYADVSLYDAGLHTLVQTLSAGGLGRSALAFSPDGSRLVQKLVGPELKIWIDGSPRPIIQLGGHETGVPVLAFSPDGSRIAVATGKLVRLWDARSAYQPGSGQVVARLRRTFVLADDMRAAARADSNLVPELKEAALRAISAAGDSPFGLNDAAWDVVKTPNATADAQARARRCAETAAKLIPWDTRFLRTLGVAQYRTGAYREAIATMERRVAMRGRPTASDFAVFAMSRQRLGEAQGASDALEKLRVEMEQPDNASDDDLMAFFRETEALVTGLGAKPAAPAGAQK